MQLKEIGERQGAQRRQVGSVLIGRFWVIRILEWPVQEDAGALVDGLGRISRKCGDARGQVWIIKACYGLVWVVRAILVEGVDGVGHFWRLGEDNLEWVQLDQKLCALEVWNEVVPGCWGA